MNTIKREDLPIRDPFVLLDHDRYYLLGTTGNDPWGHASTLMLYVSDDLEHFTEYATMVTDGSLDSYTNLWAPELHVYRGQYVLILSVYRDDLGRGCLILTSDALNHPFHLLTGHYITPDHWGCLDGTIFVSQNEPYLCFSNEWTTPIHHDGEGALFIAKMKEDLTGLAEEPRQIIGGKHVGFAIEVRNGVHQGYVAEGPWLYSKGNDIVLLWSTFTKTGYTVVRSLSHNGVYGPYVTDCLLFAQNGGHCMRFIDKNGHAWITLHQPNITPQERMVLLSDEEGNGNGTKA